MASVFLKTENWQLKTCQRLQRPQRRADLRRGAGVFWKLATEN
jgi:hypothetical protein